MLKPSDIPLLIGIVILFCTNVAAFATFAIDKRRAYHGLWRISEAALIALAVVGGAFGALTAMLLFRHKTLHRLFTITVPLCLLVWVGIVAYLLHL